MIDNPDYRSWMETYGLDDINEILSKNDYQSPEESDPENDPNSPLEHKKIFVYRLSWRSEKVIWVISYLSILIINLSNFI